MSSSRFVCFKDGLPVTMSRGAWRHALGGKTGAIPKHRKHRPVVIERSEYERFSDPGTPLDEARAIATLMRSKEAGVDLIVFGPGPPGQVTVPPVPDGTPGPPDLARLFPVGTPGQQR